MKIFNLLHIYYHGWCDTQIIRPEPDILFMHVYELVFNGCTCVILDGEDGEMMRVNVAGIASDIYDWYMVLSSGQGKRIMWSKREQ